MKNNDKDGKERVDLKREFGRVISHPERHNGQPFLNGTHITVPQILELIRLGLPDEEIVRNLPDIKQLHIDVCRAYQTRFMAHTQPGMEHLNENNKVFMLDENVSYLLLPDVARLFGWSSHVLAEGLYAENNDDEQNIWAHMRANGYKAILTEDADFKRISRSFRRRVLEQYGSATDCPEHVPVAVYISKGESRHETLALLEKHRAEIIAFIENPHAAFITVNRNGVQHHFEDKDVLAEIAALRRQTGPSSSPS